PARSIGSLKVQGQSGPCVSVVALPREKARTMKLLVEGSPLRGTVEIPGSKSHSIRAVAIAALAPGESVIRRPLDSADARAAFRAYKAFGAIIEDEGELWRIQGTGGVLKTPAGVIDVGNSGTTMRIALGS